MHERIPTPGRLHRFSDAAKTLVENIGAEGLDVGIFRAYLCVSRYDIPDTQNRIRIRMGDPLISLYLHKPQEKPSFKIVTESFSKLAKAIQDGELDGDYIVGTTYEKLANASARYGFEVSELPVSRSSLAVIQAAMKIERFLALKTLRTLRTEGNRPVICFQRTEDFLARFGSGKQ